MPFRNISEWSELRRASSCFYVPLRLGGLDQVSECLVFVEEDIEVVSLIFIYGLHELEIFPIHFWYYGGSAISAQDSKLRGFLGAMVNGGGGQHAGDLREVKQHFAAVKFTQLVLSFYSQLIEFVRRQRATYYYLKIVAFRVIMKFPFHITHPVGCIDCPQSASFDPITSEYYAPYER